MTKIVLLADHTLLSEFRNIPLGSFLSCVPVEKVPEALFNFIAPMAPDVDGVAQFAPYGLRKIEAGLLLNFKREDVVIAHPKHINKFIGPDTEIVGVYGMDPLGLGPVSLMFSYGNTAYTKKRFLDLIGSLPRGPQYKYKTVVGGPGMWQLEYNPQYMDEYHIDHIVFGEADIQVGPLFREIMNGGQPRVIKLRGSPKADQIPTIVGASVSGIVEVMRGCGRGCQFCEVTLRSNRYLPFETVRKEIEINVKNGISNVWIHTDDLFMYKFESTGKDPMMMNPNVDAIKDMLTMIMSIPGVKTALPTHGSISPAVAEPELIADMTKILRGGPNHWIGIQQGLETGSPKLMKRYMPLKVRPLSPDDWQQIVVESLHNFNKNYWFPAYTLITGLPEETTDDVLETIHLIDMMEALPNNRCSLAPLAFVPIGVLRGNQAFNADEMLDEARFNFIYRCWRHNVLQVKDNMWQLLNGPLKPALYLISKIGSDVVLKGLEKYGRSRGFEVWKPDRNVKLPISV